MGVLLARLIFWLSPDKEGLARGIEWLFEDEDAEVEAVTG